MAKAKQLYPWSIISDKEAIVSDEYGRTSARVFDDEFCSLSSIHAVKNLDALTQAIRSAGRGLQLEKRRAVRKAKEAKP